MMKRRSWAPPLARGFPLPRHTVPHPPFQGLQDLRYGVDPTWQSAPRPHRLWVRGHKAPSRCEQPGSEEGGRTQLCSALDTTPV